MVVTDGRLHAVRSKQTFDAYIDEKGYTDVKTLVACSGTVEDQLFFDQIQEEAIESDVLRQAAETNSKDDFRYVFKKAFEGLVMERMEGNEELFGKLMGNGEFRKLAVEHLLHKVYRTLRNDKKLD
jgi:hypothetical protein